MTAYMVRPDIIERACHEHRSPKYFIYQHQGRWKIIHHGNFIGGIKGHPNWATAKTRAHHHHKGWTP